MPKDRAGVGKVTPLYPVPRRARGAGGSAASEGWIAAGFAPEHEEPNRGIGTLAILGVRRAA
jgi:hypothetical protein